MAMNKDPHRARGYIVGVMMDKGAAKAFVLSLNQQKMWSISQFCIFYATRYLNMIGLLMMRKLLLKRCDSVHGLRLAS